MAQALGHESIIDVFQRFGFGVRNGAEFPGERSGELPDHDFWSAIDQVTPGIWLRTAGNAATTGACLQCFRQ